MKIIETLYKLLKKLFVLCVDHCAVSRYNFFRIHPKVVVFAAILIPCLLQIPLVGFAQERSDLIDSPLVLIEIPRECVNSEGVIISSGDSICKGRFVLLESSSKEISAVSFFGESMGGNSTNDRSYKSEKKTKNNICGITQVSASFGLTLLLGSIMGSLSTAALVWATHYRPYGL